MKVETMTELMTNEEKTHSDYTKLFEMLDDFLLEMKTMHDVGPGVSVVVLLRMAAAVSHYNAGMSVDEFADLAHHHYRMIVGATLNDKISQPNNVIAFRRKKDLG